MFIYSLASWVKKKKKNYYYLMPDLFFWIYFVAIIIKNIYILLWGVHTLDLLKKKKILRFLRVMDLRRFNLELRSLRQYVFVFLIDLVKWTF